MGSVGEVGRDGGGVSPAGPPSPSHRPTGTAFTAGTGAGFISVGNASANLRGTSRSPTRSCGRRGPAMLGTGAGDRKSTRLNSSHDQISYAVFCLKKKKHQHT